MTVYCEDCTHATQRNERFYKWLCMFSPKEPEINFVKRGVVGEPYERCSKKNKDGRCPDYEKLRKIDDEAGND